MKIYKVTQGHELHKTPQNIFDLPRVSYYTKYADALRERNSHGGQMEKYGDALSAVHDNRELWIERHIPNPLKDLCWPDMPDEPIETSIEQVEVN